MFTQVIHYPMYLCAYCVMYDIHCITHHILSIVFIKFEVNGKNSLLSIY